MTLREVFIAPLPSYTRYNIYNHFNDYIFTISQELAKLRKCKSSGIKSAVYMVSDYVGNLYVVSTPHCVKIHDNTAQNSFTNKYKECLL
jgi:hypothetical protein